MGSPAPAPAPVSGIQEVTIQVDAQGRIIAVDPDVFRIKPRSRVKWAIDSPDFEFTVQFTNDSPFAVAEFDGGPGSVVSGPAIVAPSDTTPYNYLVTTWGKNPRVSQDTSHKDPGGYVEN